MTAIECKSFSNIPSINNQIQTRKKKIEKKENNQNNFGFNRITQKRVGGANISNKNKGSSRTTTTISLSSKLSDISEKLEKYENLVNKLGKEI